MPVISAFKDGLFLNFPFLQFVRKAPAMIFYIIPSANRGAWQLKQSSSQAVLPLGLKMYIYITYRFWHWILKN